LPYLTLSYYTLSPYLAVLDVGYQYLSYIPLIPSISEAQFQTILSTREKFFGFNFQTGHRVIFRLLEQAVVLTDSIDYCILYCFFSKLLSKCSIVDLQIAHCLSFGYIMSNCPSNPSSKYKIYPEEVIFKCIYMTKYVEAETFLLW